MPFPKGTSGNPGGRPLGLIAEIRDRFKGDAIKILEAFRDIALGEDPHGWGVSCEEGIPPSVRQRCGQEVIDRCLGKAPQTILIDDVAPESPIDLSACTEDELRVLAKLKFTTLPRGDSEPSDGEVH